MIKYGATRRHHLLQLYRHALDAVAGERTVARFLQQHPLDGNYAVLAIGKAAASMALGAQQVLGGQLMSGLVITKEGHGDPRLDPSRLTLLEGGHPLPDARSLAAGRALLDFLGQLPEEVPLLVLLSGGASSLVEVLPPGVSESELAELNRWLLASGLSIAQMNAVRKRLSLIKGGGLFSYLGERPCLQLLISDVPEDCLEVIGSGPLLAPTAPEHLPGALPEWLVTLIEANPVDERVSSGSSVDSHLVADNGMARHALAEAAYLSGITVFDHAEHYQGDVLELAARFTQEVLAGPCGLYLWGGEGCVILPPQPGRGGRNQHLALAAARYLAGHDNILFLAVGTDGSDGPTEDAGALVDGGTVQRGEWEGLHAVDALEAADAGRFLEQSGDLVQTGPTGTNVMDLVIVWKW